MGLRHPFEMGFLVNGCIEFWEFLPLKNWACTLIPGGFSPLCTIDMICKIKMKRPEKEATGTAKKGEIFSFLKCDWEEGK